MSKYLFILSISPVQSFISQARKTHDLYAGSRILSELIGSAINKINAFCINKHEFVFPNQNKISNPNRLVCIVDIENNPEEFGIKIENTIKNKFWSFYYKSALNMKFDKSKKYSENNSKSKKLNKKYNLNLKLMDVINTKLTIYDTNELIKKQIDDFLQINWILQPIKDGKTYDDIYFETERLLGAIKNVRIFEQIDEPANRKCSLCGERNAYFFHSNSKPSFAYEKSYKINSPKIIHNEGLCAICCIKRFLNFNTKGKNNSFESTAEIALMATIKKIEAKSILQNYLYNFEEKDQDFQLYYKDNINERYLKKNNISCPKDIDLDKIQNELNKIYSKDTESKLKFTKYYAVLAFDGDNIGKILSGIYKKDDKKLLDFHKKLSECLNNFANKSKEIVEDKSRGRVIYAGGDDFLGFININHIFDVMEELRKEFDTIVVTAIKDFLKEDHEKNITFSAGVVIAHYKMPLAQIVKITKELVGEAKSSYNDKDSFAISVMKNSGEINKADFKWKIIKDKDKTIFTTSIMKKLTINLAKGKISNNFIKILNKEFLNFEINFMNNNDKKLKIDILNCELKRGIKKSSFGKNFDPLTSELSSLFIAVTENMKSNKQNGFNNFLSLLNIADFISREINND